MDQFFKAYSYSKREKNPYPIFVSDDVFDIVADGDTGVPLFWKGEGTASGKAVAVIPNSRKTEGLHVLGGGKILNT